MQGPHEPEPKLFYQVTLDNWSPRTISIGSWNEPQTSPS